MVQFAKSTLLFADKKADEVGLLKEDPQQA